MDKIRNKNLGKSVVVVGSTAAISQLLSVGYLVLLARWIGPEIYAVHVGIFNLCAISVFFVNWGLDTWLLKQTSEDKPSSSKVLIKILSIKILFGIIWAIAIYTIAPLLRPDIFLRNLLLLAVLSTLFESLTNSIYTVLLTTDRFRQSSAILLIGRLIRFLSLLGLTLMSIIDLNKIITVRTLIDFLVMVVAGLVFGLRFDGWRFEFGALKKTFLEAMPFHASDLVNIFFRQVDITLVTFMSRSLVTISNYSLMVSFFNVISTVVLSLMNVMVPPLSRMRNQSSGRRRKALIRSFFAFFILGLAGWVAMVLFGEQAIDLILGEQYALVAKLISKTSVFILISSLNVGLVTIIIANNRQKQRLVPQVISLAFKLIVSILIFPMYQIEGMRLIYILSEVVLSIGYFFVVSGVFGDSYQTKPVFWEDGKKLKIALITFNQEGRGTYLRAYFLGKQLASMGHKVTLLAGNVEGREVEERNENGLTVVTFPRLFKKYFLSGWGLDELLSRLFWVRNRQFDLVHAFETRPTTLIPARLLQRKGSAFFTDWADWLGRDGSVEERQDGIKKNILKIIETWYENRRFYKCDGITAICTKLVNESERRGYSKEKLLLLPNGMNNPYLHPIPLDQARVEMNLPVETVIIGYIGSGFEKDMELMYSSFNLLRSKIDNVKLLHIGRSKFSPPSDKDILLTGDIDNKKISCYLSACDIFWFPLKASLANLGRLPLKLSDYLTIGRPIVSTDAGDMASWVRDLEVGMVGKDDPVSISNLAFSIIRSTELKDTMSENARQASGNPELSWKKRAEQLQDFYYLRLNEIGDSDNFGKNDL
jgi:O-antigen/teichoic acid export membrane protein/glycosyltransferase involved in cell wall biosynthesis